MTFDSCAHGNQALCKINDFRFFCSIVDRRHPISEGRRHQQVLGTANRDDIHVDGRTTQSTMAARPHVTSVEFDFGTHGSQPFQMLIHGARSNGATARQRHFGLTETGKHWPKHQE